MLTGPADETRLIELSVPQLLSAPGLEIVVIEGPDRGARMRIGGTVQIGAAAGNDLRLTDPTVSRIHCSVTPQRFGGPPAGPRQHQWHFRRWGCAFETQIWFRDPW